ncbi:MAG: hypothetical protein AAFY28_00690 [Actinomycetota bacterium]
MTRFTARVERDLRQIADRATPSSTAWEAIQQRIAEQDTSESTTEVIMLAPNENHSNGRTRTWLMVAAAIAVLALIGGLIFATTGEDDQVPVDEPEPTVPEVEIEPEADPSVPQVEAAPTFPTGVSPDRIVFDGTSLWVTNLTDNTVSKINPDDGTRIDYDAPERPQDVAFDGTSIWIAGLSVSKMNPDDGTRIDYEAVGPYGLAFDGTSIWFTTDDGVSKMNPDDGTRVDYEAGDSGDLQSDVVFDGTSIWVINAEDDTVSKFNPDDGTRVDYPTGNQPYGLTFDGTSIWVTNRVGGTVSQINPDDGTRVDYPTGVGPRGVAFDGTNIWVVNGIDDTISKIIPE